MTVVSPPSCLESPQRFSFDFYVISLRFFIRSTAMLSKKFLLQVIYFYRPPTIVREGSIFTCVCHSVHRGVVWLSHPRTTSPPPRPEHLTPWGQYPPGTRPPPPLRNHKSGRYTSYWNAFLLWRILVKVLQ